MGLTDHMLLICLQLIHKWMNPAHPQRPQSLLHLLDLFNVLCGSPIFSDLASTNSTNVWFYALDTVRAAQSGSASIGWHGLLTWFYNNQVACPSAPLSQPLDASSSTGSAYNVDSPITRYDHARIMHFAWYTEPIMRLMVRLYGKYRGMSHPYQC